MKLKPRTTYRTFDGYLVHVAGLAKCEAIEGQRIFWTIEGDWFSEDGRFRSVRRTRNPGQPVTEEPYLAPFGYRDNIEREDNDPAWWDGVVTEPNGNTVGKAEVTE